MLSYLFGVGIPSLFGGAEQFPNEPAGVLYHDFKWMEMRANRHAARYFGKYYGVDWNRPFGGFGSTIETFYPRRRR